jgi:apolipoprotein N-acyltransferase
VDVPATATDNRPVAEPQTQNPKPKTLLLWALCALSGTLLAYSTPPHSLPGLGLVALVPLLLALPRMTFKGAFFGAYLCGGIYIAANTWWLALLPAEGGNEYIIVGMFVLSVLVRAFSIAWAGVFLRWLLTRQGRFWVWLVPLSWLGFEFIHEFNIPGPYPWLSVAYCLSWFGPFIQTADLWGAYGVAASMVLFNLAFASLFTLGGTGKLKLRREGANRIALPAAAVTLAVFGTIYGVIQEQRYTDLEAGDGPLVALVQGNVDQEIKIGDEIEQVRKAFNEQMRLTHEASQQGAELIVWPESMVFRGATRDGHCLLSEESSRSWYKTGKPDPKLIVARDSTDLFITRMRAEIFHLTHKPMLVGVVTEIPPEEQDEDWKDYNFRRHNSAMALDAQGNVAGIYDKVNLVPGGENIPNEGNPLIRWIATHYAEELQGGVAFIDPGRNRVSFSLPSKTPRLQGRPWAYTASICYEFAFPRTHAWLEGDLSTSPRPDFHVNISNEAWFGSGSELDQALVMSRFRCIETRTPMLRATNTGITCSIDACGRVREVLTADGKDRNVQGTLLVRPAVLDTSIRTWFVAIFGEMAAWLGVAVNGILAALMMVGLIRQWTGRLTAPPAK